MELEYRQLTEAEIRQALADLPGWELEDGKLVKGYHFDSYLDGVPFVGAVAYLAEKLDHHPDIVLGWRNAKVSMNTHAVEGISPYDLELARRIDALG